LQSSGPLDLGVHRPRSRILLALQALGVLKGPVRGIYYSYNLMFKGPSQGICCIVAQQCFRGLLVLLRFFLMGTACLAWYPNNTRLSFPHVMYAKN